MVGGTPERLAYISDSGEFREGEPETLWKELATRERYLVQTVDRGRPRARWTDGAPPIVVAAKRGSIRDLVATCDARHWTGVRSDHGKYKTIIHDEGPIVRRLGVTAPLEVAADALFTFVKFCNSKGVRFSGSVAGAGLSLFRTTLTKPVHFWAPPNIIDALWPGRREYWHPPARYTNMAYYDIRAAYPAALMDDGVPTHWHQIDPDRWIRNKDGYGRARVFVPYEHSPPHPVPLRLKPGTRREQISYATGAFSGTWPFRDVGEAALEGCLLDKPEECWAPSRFTNVFASPEWLELRAEMRALPGLAGTLGKLADNSLWGMFAFDNSADAEIRWLTRDGDPNRTTEKRKGGIRRMHGAGIAVVATARVRSRLLTGVRASSAIYCDTDGVIAPSSAPGWMRKGKADGDWTLKQRFDVLDVKAPQVYRWANMNDIDWHYLGESSAHSFLSSTAEKGKINGDNEGTAGTMSIRQAHLRKLMTDE